MNKKFYLSSFLKWFFLAKIWSANFSANVSKFLHKNTALAVCRFLFFILRGGGGGVKGLSFVLKYRLVFPY